MPGSSTHFDAACFARCELLARLTSWALTIAVLLGGVALADDAETSRAKLLEQMQSLAEQTKVRLVKEGQAADFFAKPVFRYDDQPRKFIDATMWVWTHQGRPIAFQKVEAMIDFRDKPLWGYCFTSLASAPLAVKWEANSFQSTAAGLTLQPLRGAPAPADKPAERKRQLRDMSRQFSARIWDAAKKDDSTAMRLLPTPIFEYSDAESKLPAGAVFGLASNGTNPDLLVLLEVVPDQGKDEWNFGAVRMTNGGLKIAYREDPVSDFEPVSSQNGRFATWMFFNTPR